MVRPAQNFALADVEFLYEDDLEKFLDENAIEIIFCDITIYQKNSLEFIRSLKSQQYVWHREAILSMKRI